MAATGKRARTEAGEMPPFTFKTLSGERLSTSDMKGKVVLIVNTATLWGLCNSLSWRVNTRELFDSVAFTKSRFHFSKSVGTTTVDFLAMNQLAKRFGGDLQVRLSSCDGSTVSFKQIHFTGTTLNYIQVLAFPCNQFGHQVRALAHKLKQIVNKPTSGLALRCRKMLAMTKYWLCSNISDQGKVQHCDRCNSVYRSSNRHLCLSGYEPVFPIMERGAVNGSDAQPIFKHLKCALPYPDDRLVPVRHCLLSYMQRHNS